MRNGGVEDNFQLAKGYKGYVSKPEITDLAPTYLVKGSKNILVDYAQRVISRNGYTLYNQANTGGGAIKGSYDWETSTGSQFSLRSYDHSLEFDWNGSYNTLLTGLRTPYIEFTKLLDYNEQQDVLIFVLGEPSFRRWSGGASKVASSTGVTLTKAGVLTGKTTIAFNAGNGTDVNPTITDSAAGFLVAGFAAGDTLSITGSTGNSSDFTIATVTADTIALIMTNILVTEVAGPAITMYNQTGPTWKAARFFSTISGRAITYQGVSYTYSGGEATDTLTGLTAFPTVTAGDAVWQTPDTISLPADITTPFPTFYPDLIDTQLNMLFLASTKSQMVFGSSNADYTDFTLTSPRAPGDPVQQPLTSGRATCIVPIDSIADVLNTTNTLVFGSGKDAFDQIDFQMSQDNSNELLRIVRYKTAVGSGLASKSAICPIKSNTVYISNEPALETFSALDTHGSAAVAIQGQDGPKNAPISDTIKADFDSYDFTDAHIRYWKRAIYVTLPAHGLLLIYDMMRNLWQPPQTIPVGRLSIINDELYGHSSVTNETYKLFVGSDDNSLPIQQVARFAYNNGGRRDRIKTMSEYWTDGYITPNGELIMNQCFGFGASLGVKEMSILGSDQTITTPIDANPLGSDPLGNDPLGGATTSETPSLSGSDVTMLRFYQADTMSALDYTEQYVEYQMSTLNGQFAIIAHGSNQVDAGTSLATHKK